MMVKKEHPNKEIIIAMAREIQGLTWETGSLARARHLGKRIEALMINEQSTLYVAKEFHK